MKNIVSSTKAPAPIGPYSQAVVVNGMVYLSGQIAIDPYSGNLVMDSIEKETKQVMKNIQEVLAAAGSSIDQVIKTSIFLSDMNDFQAVNEVYGTFFTSDFPARETVEVSKLPKDVNVEISVIASVD